jgi:hypothetical protein
MPFRMKGEYLKNCSCLASCPCDTIGVPAPHKFCEGMVGMRITEGEVDGVKLDGLKWVATVHWPGALHEGNGTVEVFIDESANQQQRDGLISILTGQQGGTLFEILSQIVTTIHGPHFVPITWEFDKEKRRATVSIPDSFETESKPLTVPPTGDEQRVIVQMPGGFEYKEMEVAQASSLKSTGAIKFEWHGTHSSLAIVEQTDKGLMDGAMAGAATG